MALTNKDVETNASYLTFIDSTFKSMLALQEQKMNFYESTFN
jgi:hypothetical protein